ncbi:MAG TPA: DUF433 domain-containing protein [Thermoanaerobaculia bacterium]|nr:DUF433 domain-containing protein [Thermoanaerobaculia bacterium]
MSERELLERITFNPEIYGGKAIIRGHRLAVSQVLDMLAAGSPPKEIVDAYDWLEMDDVKACLVYASGVIENESFMPALVASETPD